MAEVLDVVIAGAGPAGLATAIAAHQAGLAYEVVEKGVALPGHLPALVKPILPAVDLVKTLPGNMLENAVRANVRLVVDRLRSSAPILKPLVDGGKVKVVGGRYDLTSGAVEVIS